MKNPAQLPATSRPIPTERRIFCNRTLNLRSIRAIGFDMDYTLIHYRTDAWELSAYTQLKQRLQERTWPVADLEFDPDFVILGLILDLDNGNIVKANRFGYVKRACHGTRMLDFDVQRKLYSRVLVDLSEPRWVFLNTLFSLSEACMYAQLVERKDQGRLQGVNDYAHLYEIIRSALDETHAEGELKAEIMASPERFVELDEQLGLTLMDLKRAGKKLMLITNSEWHYTRAMMDYALDRFLPGDMSWRELFDLKIVQARKPTFFTQSNPFFEVVDDSGNLQPQVGPLKPGGIYLGGCAGLVEQLFGLPGEQILYVGDHIFADVHVSKSLLRWRTALVVRPLEQELHALCAFGPQQEQLNRLMAEKEQAEHAQNLARLELQRSSAGYGPKLKTGTRRIRESILTRRAKLDRLDEQITPLARDYAELNNPRWGLLMRAGNDKSNLARQIERHADIYTSRVSNLLLHTPFAYLRSPHHSLPHDRASQEGES